jgi:hypothetical protein
MNSFNENLFFILTIISLLYVIVHLTRYILHVLNLPTVRYKYKEQFVPKIIKESYRPVARNIRMTYEGFYDKTSTDISNLFRKFGIL